ncbi:MAG: hypothetical protein ABI578_07845 [Chloroflexota bacterium]
MKKKLLAPVVALGLVLATAGIALAWAQPTLTARCAPDENSYAWTINLHTESNYRVDWSFQSTFAGFATVDFASAGGHDFTTPRGGSTLYVRWTSDHASKAQATANADLCEQQSVAESVVQSVEQSVAESVQESVAESVDQSVAESVAQSVEQSVAESVQESVAESVDQSVAESVAQSVDQSVAESTGQSAEQSVEGGTGTPAASIPDSSMSVNGSSPLPTVIFGFLLLASLGALAYTNVKVVKVANNPSRKG